MPAILDKGSWNEENGSISIANNRGGTLVDEVGSGKVENDTGKDGL